jgi:hypothetical protein
MPRASTATGANPRGIAVTAPAPKPTVNDRAAQTLSTGANPRGTAIEHAPLGGISTRSPQYAQAVINVFDHQSPAQQRAVVQGALKAPSFEGNLILKHVRAQTSGPAGLTSPLTAAIKAPELGAIARAGAGTATGIFKVARNAAEDLYNLPAGTVEGLYGVGKDIITGHEGNAFHALVDPYIQLAEHPIRTFEQHPLNSALMLLGPKSMLGKGAGAIARSGALGDTAAAAASTARSDLHLGTIAGTPAPITEARSYSPDLLNQVMQKSREKYMKARGRNPNIASPAPRFIPPVLQHAFNIGHEAKLNRIADEMTAVRQMSGRGERAQALASVRAAAPHKTVAPVVSHILQGVIRTPETAVEDISKEINRLKAAQTGKRTVEEKWNRQQVKDLSTALQHPERLPEAFHAAAAIRKVVKTQDAYLVQKGLLDPEQAARRAVLPYAMAHMGASHNPLVDAFLKPNGETLPTEDIYRHLEGYRNVEMPNPDRAEARAARNEAAIAHHESLRAHHESTSEHHAAQAEHEAARGEFNAHTQGGPTPAEQRLINLVTALRNRPGTPGEGAAAQGRLDAIMARIAARTGGISRDRLTAAEQRLQEALANRSRTRRAAAQTANDLRGAERTVRETPETVTQSVYHGPQVPDPAYVGHFPGKVNPARFYSTYKLARGSLGNHAFEGKAFKNGAYDHSFEGLAGQVASRAEAVTRASLHDRVINLLGIKMPEEMRNSMVRQTFADAREKAANVKGNSVAAVAARARITRAANSEAELIRQGLFTKDEANHFARAAVIDSNLNPIPNATELTPISTAPAHVLGAVKDLQNPHELNGISSLELRALTHAIDDAQHSTSRNVVLVPSVAAKRFGEQFARTDGLLRSAGRVTQQFRRTVLPYSTHWMLQIGSEAGLRALLAGALDPRYLRDGRALMKRLEGSEEGRSALMEMVNATFYNGRDPLAVHNPNQGAISAAAHSAPISRQIIALHNAYANKVGHAMYHLEHQARLMGLGKLAHKEVSEFSRSWQNGVRLQGRALDELATRLQNNPALVAKLGRQIDDTFGKYNKFTPNQRAAIQSITPFLPWYLSAAKYVLWHLPAHHPVASAVLASLRQTVNQDIKDGKQLPLNAYAMQELARISPFGIFTPDSSTPSVQGALSGEQFTGAVLPQAEGALYNLAGDNSFGEGPLKGPGGDVKAKSPGAAAAFAENLLEAFLPLARYAREAQEGGKPAYGTSTILSPQPEQGKGQTSVANRILNPFYGFERSRASSSAPAYGPASPRATGGSSRYSIPNTNAAASGGRWTVVHSNPAGTGSTGTAWKVVK